MSRPLRVLALHADLHSRQYEASEVWQYVTSLARVPASSLRVAATDGHHVYRIAVDGEDAAAVDPVALRAVLRQRVDVLLVFGSLPLRHLLVAAHARLRGARVVFAPLALLTSDFSRSSWYQGRGRLFRRAKPAVVRMLGLVWRALSSAIVCASWEEVRQSRFPPSNAVLLPWPLPDTPLARAAASEDAVRDPSGPVALICRLDAWRKGFDRVLSWLESHDRDLPRPALLLLAPRTDVVGPIGGDVDATTAGRLRALESRGLIEWDDTSTGTQLIARLRRCRGVLLLSRWEGQPRALREALLLGQPVLTNLSSNLAEVLDVLQAGVIVDGDDAAEVQQGFEALAGIQPDPAAVRQLFDRGRIARFLVRVLHETATGRHRGIDSYYARLARGELTG